MTAESARSSGGARGLAGPGGFTLVEAALSIVIVGVLLVASLNMVGSFAKARNVQMNQLKACAAARQLMSEILQTHYAEPPGEESLWGPEPGEVNAYSRTAFDDVDDYAGLSCTPPRARDGSALAGYDGWTCSADVHYVVPPTPDVVSPTDMDLIRVVVTVTDPAGKPTTLVALRSQTSTYEHRPTVQTEYVTWAGVELQIGTDDRTAARAAGNLLNRVATGN